MTERVHRIDGEIRPPSERRIAGRARPILPQVIPSQLRNVPDGPAAASLLLDLQREAGNQAVTSVMERPAGPHPSGNPATARDSFTASATFTNSVITTVYELNKKKASPTQLVALHILDRARKGPWANLKWDDIAGSAAWRVFHPEAIDQSVLGLCGEAAALNAQADTEAISYASFVASVFEDGEAAGKKLNKRLLANKPIGGMDPCDWMLLSAMQDVTNVIRDFYGEREAKREGEWIFQEETSLRQFSSCVKTTTYFCNPDNVVEKVGTVNGLVKAHPRDVIVVMYVSSDILKDVKDASPKADHYIRLLPRGSSDPIAFTTVRGGRSSVVNFDYFTWGSTNSKSFPLDTFKKLVSGFIVGAKKESIDI